MNDIGAGMCGHFENDSTSTLRTTRFCFESESIFQPADTPDESLFDFFVEFLSTKKRAGPFAYLLRGARSFLRLASPRGAELTVFWLALGMLTWVAVVAGVNSTPPT